MDTILKTCIALAIISSALIMALVQSYINNARLKEQNTAFRGQILDFQSERIALYTALGTSGSALVEANKAASTTREMYSNLCDDQMAVLEHNLELQRQVEDEHELNIRIAEALTRSDEARASMSRKVDELESNNSSLRQRLLTAQQSIVSHMPALAQRSN
jgi:hypothetical protein